MENFDRENIDELLEIRQYFPPSKICAVRYLPWVAQYLVRRVMIEPNLYTLYLAFIECLEDWPLKGLEL